MTVSSAAEAEADQISLAQPANKNAEPMQLTAASSALTARALLAGACLGAVLAAANVYSGLKTGYIDGGSITASVLAFAAFRALRRPYSAHENNLTQTVASSAAVMSFAAGVCGPMPALARAGHVMPSWALCVWGVSLAVLGIAIGVLLRPRLIGVEGLPFPTGTATAEVIAAMAESGESALRRAKGLLLTAAAAGAIAWLRDGPLELLPQVVLLPLSVAGMSAAELSLGLAVSPLMFATGMITGLRAAVSMLAGGLVSWLVLAPWLVRTRIVAGSGHAELIAWLLWPGVGLLLSGSLVSLALQWRALVRGLLDVRLLWAGAQGSGPRTVSRGALRALLALIGLSVALVAGIAHVVLDVPILTSLLALLLSVLLCVVCARGAGETDVAPIGDLGGLTQLVFGSASNTAASLTCGGMVAGNATQTAQTLWAFKAGQRLGTSPQQQVVAQLLGAAIGGLVVVPTYHVVVRAYGLGSEKLPAIAVLSWEATAKAVQGGLQTTPPHSLFAAAIGFGVGGLLTAIGNTRIARWLPSPVAAGIGFMMPLSMSVTLTVGAVCLSLLAARAPLWTREQAESVAGGAIAGESLWSVIFAAWMALGLQ